MMNLPDALHGFYPMVRNFTVDGGEFRRLADGTVLVRKDDDNVLVLDAAGWASVVAHMSHEGGTSETYAAAKELHGEAMSNRPALPDEQEEKIAQVRWLTGELDAVRARLHAAEEWSRDAASALHAAKVIGEREGTHLNYANLDRLLTHYRETDSEVVEFLNLFWPRV